MTSRQQLRSHIRALRRSLSAAQQQQASLDLVQQLLPRPEVQQAQHIALYLTNDGELDTTPLIHALWQQGKSLYLPLLHPVVPGYLVFQLYTKDTLLKPNQFGIGEPELNCSLLCPVDQLDLMFTPLVAFDAQGQRLGMGGGFYDRTLSQLRSTSQKPALIGLAHDCQQVASVPVEAWDIPLPSICTPSRFCSFSEQ
ncbi:MAG: 5-formyltetrahydrofolate cyclo-ligase [Gammaproteobacteria bacterium]|nr:5-formyltetrahydrofolate cyclo-ligase [Gammaproteobacteria bacterium]MBU2058032.1 5-formyltetrahydrofolate cyclo-ligase [Gammaproteobacteria bacterium]MBU2173904.1 5-formyltetrahydrofolate cyclo-ligase [Gammaproteobacteria bacterium]MBU2245233.1 5-formyltetrahydrofolate cyclo-ligase [Gammaproteobacteria bacterium]MBU2343940.1 5-formyltetrahydrofolate cyclo-ligase [Gammaproteobacteria bacterium]